MNFGMGMTICLLFLIGSYGIGNLLPYILPLELKGYFHLFVLISGIGCVFAFAWPIYQFFGWLPHVKCPTKGCSDPGYLLKSRGKGSSLWKCRGCGQLLVRNGERIFIVDEDGIPISKMQLISPKILGMWRRHPL